MDEIHTKLWHILCLFNDKDYGWLIRTLHFVVYYLSLYFTVNINNTIRHY